MTRHEAREAALHIIFEAAFRDENVDSLLENRLSEESFRDLAEEYGIYASMPEENGTEYIKTLCSGVAAHERELDAYIEKYAIGWQFGRISRISVAILRLSMYEVLYMSDTIPMSASINEAVELAKTYDSPEAAAFVNGVLGSFSRHELPGTSAAAEAGAENEG